MADLIDRAKLLEALEGLRQGWAVADRVMELVFDIVKAHPGGKVKPPTFLDWRTSATEKEQKRRDDMIALHDIIEHTHSGLLEDDYND